MGFPKGTNHVCSIGAHGTICVAVEENTSCLDVSPEALNADGIITVRSYMEALGLLAAHKAGVNPACLTADIASIRDLEL